MTVQLGVLPLTLSSANLSYRNPFTSLPTSMPEEAQTRDAILFSSDGAQAPDLDIAIFRLGFIFNAYLTEEQFKRMRETLLVAPGADDSQLLLHLADQFRHDDSLTADARACAARLWIACELADQARANGDTAKAWQHVAEAREIKGELIDHLATVSNNRKRDAGRKGGQMSGLQRSPLMQECVELLSSRRPSTGWVSHHQAFEGIHSGLREFCLRNGESFSRGELWTKVEALLANHPAAQEAYAGRR